MSESDGRWLEIKNSEVSRTDYDFLNETKDNAMKMVYFNGVCWDQRLRRNIYIGWRLLHQASNFSFVVQV
jgi:hypothetical protein